MNMIEDKTSLLPYAIAQTVCHGAAIIVEDESPLLYEDALVERAEKCFAHNARFAKHLKSAKGREHLYAFMQHWLSGHLQKNHPNLFRKLPTGYSVGGV